ncbi:peroxiredoxin-like family protein [Crateriforma spongiae]|uniref:peroxiredoxin-like family protein n=1 Tax=Crateriforma spongiae TaxID=2724528 RepID=UPI00144733DF|nr:peroxiredoxin-like family protein [Crateriforma spongiae]
MKFQPFALLMTAAASLGSVLGTSVAPAAGIAPTAQQTDPIGVGADLPEVEVTSIKGEDVSLRDIADGKPTVLVFFRGGWCPICSRHTAELIKVHPKIQEAGAQIVAISPDNESSSKDNIAKNSIPFPVFSDADVSAAKAFGLAFQVDDGTLEKYKGYGIDLEKASGFDHHALPIPAVYITDANGKIVYAHSDPNYRERLDPKKILDNLPK